MAHFEVTVRLSDVNESDGPAARQAIEERLRAAGFSRWQIVAVGLQGATHKNTSQRRTNRRREMGPDISRAGGGLLVAAVVAWTLWFLWLLAG